MENITVLESLREVLVITISVAFAKLVEYLAVKLYKKVDAKNQTWLDVDE